MKTPIETVVDAINELKGCGPRYPNVTVQLTGEDGNAYVILGLVNRGLQKAKVPKRDRDLFMQQATSGDYDHLLRTAMEWVNVI